MFETILFLYINGESYFELRLKQEVNMSAPDRMRFIEPQ